ncbi:MAG: GTPase HflX [Bdellovibrionales bacterium]|nr:GTPase HflX [Bdellovibrionales bacterium]
MNQNENPRALVVGIGLKSELLAELKDHLGEIEELAHAAGYEVVGHLSQVLVQYNPAFLLGSGKIQEIKQMAQETLASTIIVDHELSGAQGRNLQQELGVRVIDRNQLILDIFAQRAQTFEGKLQVELAQMLDQLPRMVGAWLGSLSRQGSGIGTRGPGETALENDRRRIRHRLKQIRKQLQGVRQNRSQHRALRKKQGLPSFALIGYTNSGKSTLLNTLTQSQTFTKDQLFATLDPTTRKLFLPQIGAAVVTDTVGFIRKLPAHLIEAFKATLEETSAADILLHVVDLSNPQYEQQIKVVNELIALFGWDNKPLIHVFNKIDVASINKQFQVKSFPRVLVSAKTGEGLEKLRQTMAQTLLNINSTVELFFPKSQEYRIYELSRESQISRTEPASSGTICYASMTSSQITRWKEYLVQEQLETL